MEELSRRVEQPSMVRTTAVEQLVEEKFSDRRLWKPISDVYQGLPPYLQPFIYRRAFSSEATVTPGQSTWSALMSGIRLTPHPQEKGAYKLEEVADVETLTALQQAVSEEILTDEKIHVATRLHKPVLKKAFGLDASVSIEDKHLIAWLEAIGDKEDPCWPMMMLRRPIIRRLVDYGHDRRDHLIAFATSPRERQDGWTEAAGHALRRLRNG